MKTATQILNEHLLPATAPNIHALEEYASEQCRQRDELIKAQDELIKLTEEGENVYNTYKMDQLRGKIEQLKSQL